MSAPTAPIVEALAALDAAWGVCDDVTTLADDALLSVNDRVCAVRRQLDGLHAKVAAEVASRSRPELGKNGLARKAGHRTPAKLIATATGGHSGDASRLIQVGQATAPRTSLVGEALPAKHPHLATALDEGGLSVPAAAAITSMLDKLPPRVGTADRLAAEQTLAAHAPQLSLDELHAVLRRAEAMLDPDGLEPKIDELRAGTWLKMWQDAAGFTLFDGRFDPVTAAPIVAAVQGIVTHQLRAGRGHNHPGAARPDAAAAADAPAVDAGAPVDTPPVAGHGPTGAAAETPAVPVMGIETRSIPEMNAAALAAIARHTAGCDRNTVPGSATTVVVRMGLDDLRPPPLDDPGGTAFGTRGTGSTSRQPPMIDGFAQPIDAGSARRMAATAGFIPLVLGTGSEALDLGRRSRPYSAGQRVVLAERDGGCANCHLPPAFTEAHHLTFWSHGGTTDLDNGVLLCTSCHHRLHDEGWSVRIDTPPGGPPHAGTVWFIPPAHIDPARTPRLGGRARFDPLTWGLTG